METWKQAVLYGIMFTLPRVDLAEEFNRTRKIGPEKLFLNCRGDRQSFKRDGDPVECLNIHQLSQVNTTDILSEEDFDVFSNNIYRNLSFVILGILSPVLHVTGIVGNILILVVLCRGVIKSSSTPYFVGLAFADLLLLTVSGLGMFGVYQTVSERSGWKMFYAFFVGHLSPLVAASFTSGVWVTVAFTVERFIAICHPMTAQRHCTGFRAKVVVTSAYAFGFVLNFPRWFRRSLIVTTDPFTNETFYKAQLTSLGVSATYNAYRLWSGFVARGILPLTILAVLNYFIIRQLVKSKRLRTSMVSGVAARGAEQNLRDHHITRTLLAILVVFFVCNTGIATSDVALAIMGTDIYVVLEFRYFLLVSNMAAVSNSVFNCVLYPLCSRSVRRAVLDILLLRSQSHVSTTTTTTTATPKL